MVHLTATQLDALRDVRAEWPDASMVLIGAQALGAHIDMRYRETDDLDLAIAITLVEFPAGLPGRPGWSRDARMEQRFRGPAGQIVDVLPVGAALGHAEPTLAWPSGHVMSLVGFDLAFTHAETVVLDDVPLLLPSAPALAFLKLRAWLDRPAEREKDLQDLAHLLATYVGDDDVRRWEEALPEALDFADVAAFLLGRDLGAICDAHHRPHVSAFLRAITPARLAARGPWVLAPRDEAERALSAFGAGWAGAP